MTDAEQKKNSLLLAFRKAGEILAESDPGETCDRTGAAFTDGEFQVEFLGRDYRITVPEVAFATDGLPTIAQVLILHYLTTVGEHPEKGEFQSFRTLPGGMFYAQSFENRAVNKLLAGFQGDPDGLAAAAQALGGQRWTSGDFSSVLRVFPRIDVVVQIFAGDDEFPAEANVLFSDNVVNFLPVEDTAFLGGWVVSNLVRGSG